MKNDNSTTPIWLLILLGLSILAHGIIINGLRHRINSLEVQVEILRERQDIYEIYL